MLIPSPRHTPRDLELWAELEAADHVAGRSPRLLARAKKAIGRIVEFSQDACYLSVSWGKDSVAVADLVLRAAPAVPLMWVRVEPHGNPDCPAARDAFLSRWPGAVYHEIVVRVDGPRPGTGILEEGFREAARRFGPRYISGCRAGESGARRIQYRVNGGITHNTLWPIGSWSDADVFAWLAGRDLPVHPAYAMLGGGRWPRKHVRVATLGGERGDQFGRRQWEEEYYPDVLRRLESGR